MAPFYYGWSSTASRLQPLRGGSLLFTIQFPEIPVLPYPFLFNKNNFSREMKPKLGNKYCK